MIGADNVKDIACMGDDLLFSILGMAAWGGIVRFIMLRKNHALMTGFTGCFLQVIISCFIGMILSIFVLSRNASSERVLIVAGLGGVFASPIMAILGKKIAIWVESLSPSPPKNPDKKKLNK